MQQLILDIGTLPAPAFDNFVPGRNGELLAMLGRLAAGVERERFVYLWGAPGSGRSHLLRATAAALKADGRASRYFACGRETLPDVIAPGAALVLDDVDRLDAAAQIAAFNFYNRIREDGGALIASGALPAAALPLRPDLVTRLAWGLVYEVHGLSDDEKKQALKQHAYGRGFELPDDACRYLLDHARRDLPSLLALLDALDRQSLASKRAITLPLIREVLKGCEVRGVRGEE
ncbi:MAG TPA: DnaA regulatory inactivator Hda [Burkholderiales bacterium]|nr:DnaA regulatory inactivator Hda [Burkholderiales bacterium]